MLKVTKKTILKYVIKPGDCDECVNVQVIRLPTMRQPLTISEINVLIYLNTALPHSTLTLYRGIFDLQ